MELEEMKQLWQDMSEQRKKQERLTQKAIIMMTQQQYKSRLRQIIVHEAIGSVLCLGFLLLILLNFSKYDTPYLVVCGIASAAIFLVLPLFSFALLRSLGNLPLAGHTYKQTIIEFTKRRRRFLLFQKFNIGFGGLLFFTFLPVMTKILNGENINIFSGAWKWFLLVGGVFFIFFATWVYGCYARTTNRMEETLKELED
jgi:hypothetical protein